MKKDSKPYVIERVKLEFQDTDYLWRYMSLSKFIHLALNSKIFFARIDHFEDTQEGITQQMLWQKLQGGTSSDKVLQSMQKSTFVSCWFKSIRESVAMWNLYAGRDGVAIKVKAKEFVSFIESKSYSIEYEGNLSNVVLGMVDYMDFKDPEKVTGKGFKQKYSALRKDLSFEHEKEFRMVLKYRKLELPEKKLVFHYPGINLTINTSDSPKFEVVLNPRMALWEASNIEEIIKKSNLIMSYSFSELQLR